MSSQNPDPNVLELITQNQRALYGYILSLVFSRDTADEVLQDTNVVLCRKIHEFDGRASFLTWACAIARYEVLAMRKRRLRDKLTTVDDDLLDQLGELALAQAAEADVRIPFLRQCVSELPDSQQKMIEVRYGPDGSVTSLADSLSRTPESIRVTMHRLRRRLLKCVETKLAAMESK